MTCYDPRDDSEVAIRDNKRLEGILCAIVNELERRGLTLEVISEAQRHGKIEIFPFIQEHMNKDINRLAKDITSRYSKDELELIKQIVPVVV